MSMKYIEEMSRKGISYKKFNSAFGAKILEKFGWKEGEGLGKAKNGITEAIQIKRREENMGLGKTKKEQIWNDKWWEQSYNNILKEIKPKQDEKKEKYNLRKKSEDRTPKKRKNSNVSNISKERKNSRKNSISSNYNKRSRKTSKDETNIKNNNNKLLKKKRKITFIEI